MAKKKVKKKVVEPEVKYLTNAQMKIITENERWMQLKTLEHRCATLEFENKRLYAELELKELKIKSEMIKKEIDDKINTHKGNMQVIAQTLNIKGGWGFDPETGEVKED